MNWFQRFFTNPNVHAVFSGLVNAAQPVAYATGHPDIGMAIAAVGTIAGLQAAATPENPVAVPVAVASTPIPGHATGGPVIQLPPAAAGGSYHASDWINLAATLAAQFTPPAPVAAVVVKP